MPIAEKGGCWLIAGPTCFVIEGNWPGTRVHRSLRSRS